MAKRQGDSIYFVLAIHVRVNGVHAGSCKGEQPAYVFRGDKVPGGPHDVGTQDSALGKGVVEGQVGSRTQALADTPLSGGVVLCLDSAEATDHGMRTLASLWREMLIAEPQLWY